MTETQEASLGWQKTQNIFHVWGGGAFYAFSLLNALEMLLLAEFVIFFWISELLLLLLLFFSICFCTKETAVKSYPATDSLSLD